jgi:hypothetical protein
MTVWPTIGATGPGRWVGRMCAVGTGFGQFFTLGKLLAVLTLPVTLAVYFWQLLPGVCLRYTITSRRIVIRRGFGALQVQAIELDGFDAIAVEVLPGQDWLNCGEIIFKRAGREVFRLSGVSRPLVYRLVCLKAQQALISVRKVLAAQTAS